MRSLRPTRGCTRRSPPLPPPSPPVLHLCPRPLPLQAVADFSAALELCTEGAAAAMATHLLLARAAAHEQLEAYGPALEDLRQAAARQQPAVDPQVGGEVGWSPLLCFAHLPPHPCLAPMGVMCGCAALPVLARCGSSSAHLISDCDAAPDPCSCARLSHPASPCTSQRGRPTRSLRLLLCRWRWASSAWGGACAKQSACSRDRAGAVQGRRSLPQCPVSPPSSRPGPGGSSASEVQPGTPDIPWAPPSGAYSGRRLLTHTQQQLCSQVSSSTDTLKGARKGHDKPHLSCISCFYYNQRFLCT